MASGRIVSGNGGLGNVFFLTDDVIFAAGQQKKAGQGEYYVSHSSFI
jgi:hypothetical protein